MVGKAAKAIMGGGTFCHFVTKSIYWPLHVAAAIWNDEGLKIDAQVWLVVPTRLSLPPLPATPMPYSTQSAKPAPNAYLH
jgi:hypothetical protein